MNRIRFWLTAVISVIMLAIFHTPGYADTIVFNEDFESGSHAVKNAANENVWNGVIKADEGDEKHGNVFKTLVSSTSDWYIDLGRTYTAEDNNVVKISMDIKAPMVQNKNVLFYLADSSNVSTKAYDVLNSSYRKKAFYFRTNGKMGVNIDTTTAGSWYKSDESSVKAYAAGQWYHVEIVVDLYRQMATYYLDNEVWSVITFGASGKFEAFDMIGVRTESTNKTGYWYIDNITVTDKTVEVDETILYEADFEEVSSGAEAGITFVYGENASAVEEAEDTYYGKVLRFSATETITSRLKIPVNASETEGKAITVSFDLYAENADKHYCMIYLYDYAGTAYKILCRNSNQASGTMGYYKFLNTGAPWKPDGAVAKSAGSWVHVDGIFEFRDNQTVITWYFDGVKAGVTYSHTLKDLSYIRFNVNKTETANVTKTFAVDNIVMRAYDLGKFKVKHNLTGNGEETVLEIMPRSNMPKNISVADCEFEITDSQTGEKIDIVSGEYKNGTVYLKLSGVRFNKPYTVVAKDFCDLYGQSMESFEFYANPQLDDKNNIVSAIKAVWFYDESGNRLSGNNITTEVNKMEILFNNRMLASSVSDITFGDIALTGKYNSKNNSYTATWDGYLAPYTGYNLSVKGVKDVNGNVMADYTEAVSTGKGSIAVKKIELLNQQGEQATSSDINEDTVLTAKLSVLNTSGEDVYGVLAYGIYKDSYMTDYDFATHYLAYGSVTEIEIDIPYTDIDSTVKVFMLDEFSKLNPYDIDFDLSVKE